MGRPRYKVGVKRPNIANIRIPLEVKPLIQQTYRQIVGSSSPGMPIGDKLLTVLRDTRKKVEASEAEIRRLDDLLDTATNNWKLIKPMVIRNEQR